MSKNKEKHHSPEEPDKNGKAKEKAPDNDKAACTPAEQAPGPVIESQKEKPAKAEHEIARLKDQLLRLQADFENFRKRSLREKGEIYENANEALLLVLLPVIDHIQMAFKSAGEHQSPRDTGQTAAAFREGMQLIADQMMTVLAKYGLDPFNSEKQPFDPNLHEAISCLPSETEPEGVIIAQSRQGYRYKNRMLRPAQVAVSSGPSTPTESETNNQLKED